jgi:hypothetical protein
VCSVECVRISCTTSSTTAQWPKTPTLRSKEAVEVQSGDI